jgi:hypothetical protein
MAPRKHVWELSPIYSLGQGKNSLFTFLVHVDFHALQLWKARPLKTRSSIFQQVSGCEGMELQMHWPLRRSHFVNDRSPRLFPHIVVRNLRRRASELSTPTTDSTSDSPLLRTWVECDPEFDEDLLGHPLNRWTILGIAIVIATSGAFWTGMGLLINHFLR